MRPLTVKGFCLGPVTVIVMAYAIPARPLPRSALIDLSEGVGFVAEAPKQELQVADAA